MGTKHSAPSDEAYTKDLYAKLKSDMNEFSALMEKIRETAKNRKQHKSCVAELHNLRFEGLMYVEAFMPIVPRERVRWNTDVTKWRRKWYLFKKKNKLLL